MTQENPQSWATIAELSARLGIFRSKLYPEVRQASRRGETWVKKEPFGGNVLIWLIDTQSAGYQELSTRLARRKQLRAPRPLLLDLKDATWDEEEEEPFALFNRTLRLRLAMHYQAICTRLSDLGLIVYQNALQEQAIATWDWEWENVRGDGFETKSEAICDALKLMSRLHTPRSRPPVAGAGRA